MRTLGSKAVAIDTRRVRVRASVGLRGSLRGNAMSSRSTISVQRRRTDSGHPQQGLISGYLFKLLREALGLSQEALAEALGVGKNTVQGWETGRRPLANVRRGDLFRLTHQLRGLGSDPGLLGLLDDALEADHFLDDLLAADPETVDSSSHPLAQLVIRRGFSDLLSWPFTGEPPIAASAAAPLRRGPAPSGPALAAADQARFFTHLRAVTERAWSPRVEADAGSVLLRRQSYYLASWDSTGQSRRWLEEMQRREGRRRYPLDRWTPQWTATRSLLVARARQGDREPLQAFIRGAIASPELEAANLNYWAYWISESSGTAHGDDFMAGGLGRWSGAALLGRLLERLTPEEPTVDLYVHSVWSLVLARPWVLEADHGLRTALQGRVDVLLDAPEMPRETRGKLDNLRYGIELRKPPAAAQA